ncbi:iron-sulfur cluster assembly protein [Virgibacillus sp. C22-A2]|uniref:Iron-sulfur cluster assembly protein n=1 Tax=Virgibacillus tibetensis TaxID=3042313 RepID=A0ABU6KE60_9BACI|nr:iron-sulfur cluster assembly protein [Virgibacillus sp. C22-A2]
MSLESNVNAALSDVIDPELGINIVDLGLIYGIDIQETVVIIRMTLTTPGCPMHDSIRIGVEHRISQVDGVSDVQVEISWDPAWNPGKMSNKARESLGL